MPEEKRITVVKEFTFDAAHYLPDHRGKCKHLHGHTYKLQVGIQGDVDRKTGMVVDFGDLSAVVKEAILEHLDHAYLNEVEIEGFPNEQPTAENMARWIKRTLQKRLWQQDVSLVRLWETPTSYTEVKNA
jgi:6-pyruvoyltetrahydropterin/6-carboxytetrahydropterin synthase